MPFFESTEYKILIDIIIPIASLLFGIFLEKRFSVTQKITKINTSQTSNGDHSQGVGRDNNGIMINNYPNSNNPVVLNQKQEALREGISSYLERVNLEDNFSDKYRLAYKNLNNNSVSMAASHYLFAFSEIKNIFLVKKNYTNSVNSTLIKVFEDNLNTLKKYSDEAKDNYEELQNMIAGIENTLTSLIAYLK
jgi:hypothetical protein